jgi:type III secretory pathway component EscR
MQVHLLLHVRRVIDELGGMKPGPRSFERCPSLCFSEMVSNQTAFPSTISFSWRERERDRERGDCLILIWPCIVFHGPLYVYIYIYIYIYIDIDIYVGKGRVACGSGDMSPTFYSTPIKLFAL